MERRRSANRQRWRLGYQRQRLLNMTTRHSFAHQYAAGKRRPTSNSSSYITSTERSQCKVNLYLSFRFLPQTAYCALHATSKARLTCIVTTGIAYNSTVHLAYKTLSIQSTFSIPASQSLCWLSLIPLPSHEQAVPERVERSDLSQTLSSS